MTRDTIERELVLGAPIEQVWMAITDSAQVSKWFGSEGTIDLRPGGAASFGWPGFGTFHARVDEVDPPRRFVYRWCIDKDTPVDEGPTTRVEFTLVEVAEGTRLQLVESGFASLPEGVRDRHLSENTDGWREELAELAEYVEAAAA